MKRIANCAMGIVLFASLSSTAIAQCGDPAAGDCCASTGTQFCNDAECCATVCALQPQCCNVVWNASCSNYAKLHCVALCGSCGTGSSVGKPCCAVSPTPYCYNAPCCDSVCAELPHCCDPDGPGWNQQCADLAWQLCPDLPGCQPPTCPGEGNCCKANGSPFCNNADCCNAVCDLDPYCCDIEWNECCAQLAAETCPHPWWPDSNLCDDPPEFVCGAGAGDCCSANGSPGCSDPKCCKAICDADPYCCNFTWDGICANAAGNHCDCHCGTVCSPVCEFTNPTSNCFETGGTGCWDFECCESVCACDVFCCTAEWDEFCVGPNLDIPGCSAINLCCHLIDCNPADLTHDNIVDVFDVLELLSVWGPCPGYGEHCPDPDLCPADFNHDGLVNVFDLLFMLSNWG